MQKRLVRIGRVRPATAGSTTPTQQTFRRAPHPADSPIAMQPPASLMSKGLTKISLVSTREVPTQPHTRRSLTTRLTVSYSFKDRDLTGSARLARTKHGRALTPSAKWRTLDGTPLTGVGAQTEGKGKDLIDFRTEPDHWKVVNFYNDVLGVKRMEVIAQQIVTNVGARNSKDLLQDFRRWLSPPDPSTNHNIICSAQHERTAAWAFNIFKEWELSGFLLSIHGKYVLKRVVCMSLTNPAFVAVLGKGILWLDFLLSLRIQGLTLLISSAIIQHIIAPRDAGSASIAYFYSI
ncbi:hypothetical protein BJY52DRAFT_103284 [Lactarius psammicola]|nr:hypothetical protein BJY52DRAFT_103284 [Lactarius psammicola]